MKAVGDMLEMVL